MRASEQISQADYYARPMYWEQRAELVGGVEVCDSRDGQVLFTLVG